MEVVAGAEVVESALLIKSVAGLKNLMVVATTNALSTILLVPSSKQILTINRLISNLRCHIISNLLGLANSELIAVNLKKEPALIFTVKATNQHLLHSHTPLITSHATVLLPGIATRSAAIFST